METLTGINIERLGFVAEKRGDLLYHEGPLLSHFVDVQDTKIHYLYKWCDTNGKVTRWLISRTDSITLLSFFYKRLTLRQIIESQPYVFFVDLDNTLSPQNIYISRPSDLPHDYLPDENSIYDEFVYEGYAETLKRTLPTTQSILQYERRSANFQPSYNLDALMTQNSRQTHSFRLSCPPGSIKPSSIHAEGWDADSRTNTNVWVMMNGDFFMFSDLSELAQTLATQKKDDSEPFSRIYNLMFPANH